MTTVVINKKEYPVVYSMPAILWFADFVGIRLNEVDFADIDFFGRKGFALMYSGLVAGCEAQSKRLGISFSEFQEVVMNDETLQETLGTLFQKQMEIMISKAAAKVAEKESKKKSRLSK